MINYLKRLFCNHKYIQIDWYETEDEKQNIRYSMRKYKCDKCGKEIWVDGRYDCILWKEIKEYYKY